MEPWFKPTSERADWQLRLSGAPDTYEEARAQPPAVADPRACFALDTYVLSLPAWSAGGRLKVADSERSCFLTVSPFEIDLLGDPRTRRWRFTAALVLLEIAATRMRQTSLDLHSAAVEAVGRSILIVGPKDAGKTTLAFYLLRSGSCRALANDRVFASAAGTAFVVHGVPTAVKIRQRTLVEFPELLRRLPAVERPYLYSLDELTQASPCGERTELAELALSPPQLLRQLEVDARASAPLGAIVFPRIQGDVDGGDVVPLSPAEVRAGIWANLYGNPSGRREPTVFEELDGGVIPPSPSLVDRLSRAVPGYRVLLGPRAYATRELAARLLEIVTRGRSQ